MLGIRRADQNPAEIEVKIITKLKQKAYIYFAFIYPMLKRLPGDAVILREFCKISVIMFGDHLPDAVANALSLFFGK